MAWRWKHSSFSTFYRYCLLDPHVHPTPLSLAPHRQHSHAHPPGTPPMTLLQVHGFPKVMGVLNHLDHFRHSKSLKRTKKTLKTRLQTEIHAGAKLFYLSGMMYGTVSLLTHSCIANTCCLHLLLRLHATNGLTRAPSHHHHHHHQYLKQEIHNLALYLSRIKTRPLTWRAAHPHLLVDRYEVSAAAPLQPDNAK